MVRRTMQRQRMRAAIRRFGFRQHFVVRPWTDVVEVYWHSRGQAYVTPVAEKEICVALITSDPHFRMQEMGRAFPDLAARLAGAQASTREQGAITITRQFDTVCEGDVALVGEASGSVDAITGEGMSLGFQQAAALVSAMRQGSLQEYERAHRKIGANARHMARLMLLLGRGPRLRRRALHALASRPELFAQMLSVHVGETPMLEFGMSRALSLGWAMLRA
jgi:flavin-dependent dehydrogenase